jgi:hypothetical protein
MLRHITLVLEDHGGESSSCLKLLSFVRIDSEDVERLLLVGTNDRAL